MKTAIVITLLCLILAGAIIFIDIKHEPVKHAKVSTIIGCIETAHTPESYEANKKLLEDLGYDSLQYMGMRCD